jgi:hypothetical protein
VWIPREVIGSNAAILRAAMCCSHHEYRSSGFLHEFIVVTDELKVKLLDRKCLEMKSLHLASSRILTRILGTIVRWELTQSRIPRQLLIMQ